MGLTRKMNRHLDSNSGLPPELTNSINDLFDEVYGGSDQEEDEDDQVQLARLLEFAELLGVLLAHHVADEGGAQLANQHENDRARDDAADQNNQRAEPGAVHETGCHLDELAGDEGHDDLQDLHAEQDEDAAGAHVLHALHDAVHTARLIGVAQEGPEAIGCIADDGEKGEQAKGANDVAVGKTPVLLAVRHNASQCDRANNPINLRARL